MSDRSRFVPRLLALCAAMALAGPSFASDGHGEGHGAAAPAPSAKASVKLTSKADLKAASLVEGKGEAKAPVKGELADDARTNVSMAELRDLIDQKIAEVRARQEAAAVVKVTNRAPARPRRDPGFMNAAYNPHQADAGAGHDGALRPVASRPSKAAAKPGQGTAARSADARHAADGHDVHWHYGGATGPDNWGTLKPEFRQCMLGKRQSPIDIRDGIRVQLEPIQFDYRPTPFTVVDNGHTVQVNVQPGNSITVSGRRYELLQFHFHRPSEERINGRQYEMVAHLVHKDPEGRLAVIAVLMDQGKAHPMVQLVWNSLPLERNTDQASPVQMDLNQMLPEQRQYYTYMGSLTTPPCSEGVLWMVMKQPATMTREQIDIFARLYPMNARPIQSASGRLIKDGQ